MPMTATTIPRVAPKARQYVDEVLNFGFHNTTSLGFGKRLEQQFAQRFGQRYGILVANGTVTMQAALEGAGIGVGDEVIVPAYTVFSTASAVLDCNAVPVVVDVDPATFTMDVEQVRRNITPRTKAIIPVSICGLPPDMDGLMALAKQHNLIVIEDNAQCYLGYYRGRVVGSMGHFASFSFQSSKHMTCGDGGILICSDEALATGARRAASLGFSTVSARPGENVIPEAQRCHPEFSRHSWLGHAYRLSEVSAAVALAEFERLDELVAMRQACANVIAQVVADCDWLKPQHTPDHCVHSYWVYAARIMRDDIDWAALRRKYLELGGDGFYGAYLPLHREAVFANLVHAVREQPQRYPQWADRLPDYGAGTCPVWEAIQPRIIQFKTNYFDLADARREADLIARALRSFD